MSVRTEGGLSAALSRLEEAYAETDMSVEEYRRRKARITEQYLDSPIPSGGLLTRAAHGDRAAILKTAVIGVVLLALIILALVIGGIALAPDQYVGGDT